MPPTLATQEQARDNEVASSKRPIVAVVEAHSGWTSLNSEGNHLECGPTMYLGVSTNNESGDHR